MSVFMSFSSLANDKVFYASRLTDNSGLVYIGYEIDKTLIVKYLKNMQAHLGNEKFHTFRANQIKRDHSSFHITLINPYEYPDIESIDISALPSVSFSFKGLGHGQKLKDSTYFIVASSNEAQTIRKGFGLKEKDFHITLGFDTKDVFGIDKSNASLIR